MFNPGWVRFTAHLLMNINNYDLPDEISCHIVAHMDIDSALCFVKTCNMYHSMYIESLYEKAKSSNYICIVCLVRYNSISYLEYLRKKGVFNKFYDDIKARICRCPCWSSRGLHRMAMNEAFRWNNMDMVFYLKNTFRTIIEYDCVYNAIIRNNHIVADSFKKIISVWELLEFATAALFYGNVDMACKFYYEGLSRGNIPSRICYISGLCGTVIAAHQLYSEFMNTLGKLPLLGISSE